MPVPVVATAVAIAIAIAIPAPVAGVTRGNGNARRADGNAPGNVIRGRGGRERGGADNYGGDGGDGSDALHDASFVRTQCRSDRGGFGPCNRQRSTGRPR